MGSGTNGEGYSCALLDTFRSLGYALDEIPTKSALCQFRQRISYRFCSEYLTELLEGFAPERGTWRGLHVYATDGLDLLLPRTADVLRHGYSGRAVSKYRDTYYPRMYFTHTFDVLSGVTKDLRQHPQLDEIADALEMIPGLEKNSLTLYDRLFISKKPVIAHERAGNYFLFRCRRRGVPKGIQNFFSSHKTRMQFTWPGTKIKLTLIKVKNAQTGKYDAFATNLPESWVGEDTIRQLYGLRWEVETSFRDFVDTSLKMEQWHSKFLNGILQELYARLWLWNWMKIQTHLRRKKSENPLDPKYEKPNFRLILRYLMSLLPRILKRARGVLKDLESLINKSTERRTRRSRRYKRELKYPRSPYPHCNTVWVL